MGRIVDDMDKMTKEQTGRKHDKDIDAAFVADMLRRHADNCGELADRMNREGRPLERDEKQLVRFAICPILDDIAGELKSAFLSGQKAWVETSLDALTSRIMPFMD